MQVYDAGIKAGDFEAIKAFMVSDANMEVPELSEDGTKVLDNLMSKNYNPLWNTVLARLVSLVPAGFQEEISPGVWRPVYINHDSGDPTTRVDTYHHEVEHGKVAIDPVQIDTSNPEFADGIYIVGTPL